MKVIRPWLLLSVPLLLVVLAGTLLYLRSLGAWHDPVKWIEHTEVALLWGLIVLGIWAFWQTLKGLVK